MRKFRENLILKKHFPPQGAPIVRQLQKLNIRPTGHPRPNSAALRQNFEKCKFSDKNVPFSRWPDPPRSNRHFADLPPAWKGRPNAVG